MRRLRVGVVTSNPSGNAARVAEYLGRRVPEVELVGAIVDLGTSTDRRRQWRRLRAWRRHGGLRYVVWRLWLEVEARLGSAPPAPRYRTSLHELGRNLSFHVVEVPNVNSESAIAALRDLDLDLGVSVGNRVIEQEVLSIPRNGMINLHHGRIPRFRGGPPAFWELLGREEAMGVSVHRMDRQLDHGELLAQAEVPVQPGDDPKTLMERAHRVDFALVAEAARAIALGTAEPIPVDMNAGTVRTLPARAELRALRARLGQPIRHDDFRRAELPDLPVVDQ